MTTQAALDPHAPRLGARPHEDSPSTNPHGALTWGTNGPVYAGIAVVALAVAGATAVGLRWGTVPDARRACGGRAPGAFGDPAAQRRVPPPRRPAPGRVVVVGAGNSGLQIADELAAAGRTVTLAVGSRSRTVRSGFSARTCSGG